MEINSSDRGWVVNRLAQLEPPAEWTPDAEMAYRRFEATQAVSPRSITWRWAAVAAAVMVAALIALPGTRAIAQRLWDLIALNRVEVIRTDVEDLPDDVQDALRANITVSPGQPQRMSSLDEASQRAGFDVRLPRPNVLTGSPELAVLGPINAELRLKVEALERAARSSRADLPIPREWEGVRIGVNTGNSVIAAWTSVDVTLMQARPFVMSVPPGFQLTAFTEMALRILRLDAAQAKRLSERAASNPAFFFGISREDKADIREVSLRSGPGTLIHSLDDNDGSLQSTELIWSTSDRVYVLSGKMSDELTITVANSMQ